MTNDKTTNHHADRRSDSSNDALPHRSVRRAVSALRRGWSDATYLNRRMIERL
jgi:hypothetical protein